MQPSDWYRDPYSDTYIHRPTGQRLSAVALQSLVDSMNRFQQGSGAQWINSTAASRIAYPTGYPSAQYVPPPQWHNFPCGHQLKLEPGQPAPMRCPTCPAPEYSVHEYKCGHVHNYDKTAPYSVPTECPTCSARRSAEAAEAKKRADDLAAEGALREAEGKQPLAWLDKQVSLVADGALA